MALEHSREPGVPDASRPAPACTIDQDVASLDPLEADPIFVSLPAWNRAGDAESIALALASITPSRERVAMMTIPESIAALRDIGMLASSLMRHGVDFRTAAPDLEPRLVELGEKVDMVPRDTVYHYGAWNPAGSRERSFTGDPAESSLIAAARTAAPAIEEAIELLLATAELPLESAAFAEGCQRAARRLAQLLCSIGKAKREIPPIFFAQTLRPYFADLTIGGVTYAGASAAPISVCVVDHIVWSSDCRDRRFAAFQAEQLRYNLPRWRRLYTTTLGEPSLTTRLLAAAADGDPAIGESIAAVLEILQVLLVFRGRHRYVAMRAYDEKIRLFEVGSGGHGPSTLTHLFSLTRAAFTSLRAAALALNQGDAP